MSYNKTATQDIYADATTTVFTLTASAVPSIPLLVDFDDIIHLYAKYTPGSNGSELQFSIELSPLDNVEDPLNTSWFPYGTYTAGDFTTTTFNSGASTTAGTAVFMASIDLNVMAAKRIRLLPLEVPVGAAGEAIFYGSTKSY